MIDFHTNERHKFLRRLKRLAWLRGFYIAACGLSIGVALGAVFNLFSKGHP